MNKLMTLGVRQLFSGARRGQPGMAGLGAALTIAGWMRSRRRGRELIYARTLKDGESVNIRLVRGEAVDDDGG
jgi:hypothetical protein